MDIEWMEREMKRRLKYLWIQFEGEHKDNPFIGSEITFLQLMYNHLVGQSPDNHASSNDTRGESEPLEGQALGCTREAERGEL